VQIRQNENLCRVYFNGYSLIRSHHDGDGGHRSLYPYLFDSGNEDRIFEVTTGGRKMDRNIYANSFWAIWKRPSTSP
jgi:hypothetical protein